MEDLQDINDLRNFRYYPELRIEYDLSTDTAVLLSFLLQRCYPVRYCGLSNEHIGEILGASYSTIKRSLKQLRDLDLIIIENSGTFKRKIFINPDIDKNAVFSDLLESPYCQLRKRINPL